jgi:hypothetical protein
MRFHTRNWYYESLSVHSLIVWCNLTIPYLRYMSEFVSTARPWWGEFHAWGTFDAGLYRLVVQLPLTSWVNQVHTWEKAADTTPLVSCAGERARLWHNEESNLVPVKKRLFESCQIRSPSVSCRSALDCPSRQWTRRSNLHGREDGRRHVLIDWDLSIGKVSWGWTTSSVISQTDRPFKKLPSDPVASPRECPSRNQA